MKPLSAEFTREKIIKGLLVPIMSDLSAPPGKAQRGSYLKKLLEPKKLEDHEKKLFYKEYFIQITKSEKAQRAFTGATPEDQQAREYFLQALSDYFRTRVRQAGDTKKRRDETLNDFSITAERQFLFKDKDVTKNIYNLGLKIVRKMETFYLQDKINEDYNNGKINEIQRSQLLSEAEKGNVTMVDIDGETKFLTRAQLELFLQDQNNKNKKLKVYFETGMKEVLAYDYIRPEPQSTKSTPPTAPTVATAELSVSAEIAGKQTTTPKSDSATITVTAANIQEEFKEKAEDRYEEMLVGSGLILLDETGNPTTGNSLKTDENGLIKGRVKDKNGQEMTIIIDTKNPDENSPNKIIFICRGGEHDGERINMTEEDMKKNAKETAPEFNAEKLISFEKGRKPPGEQKTAELLNLQFASAIPAGILKPEPPGTGSGIPPETTYRQTAGTPTVSFRRTGLAIKKKPVTIRGKKAIRASRPKIATTISSLPVSISTPPPAPGGKQAVIPRESQTQQLLRQQTRQPQSPTALRQRRTGNNNSLWPVARNTAIGLGAGAGAGAAGLGALIFEDSTTSTTSHIIHFIIGCIGNICIT